MNDGDGNPPIDFDQAIQIGGRHPPLPSAEFCMEGIRGGVDPAQVGAMALVGVLHQLEVQSELEAGKLQEVRDALTSLADATDEEFAQLYGKAERAADFSGTLLAKADVYRERLEVIEQAAKAEHLVQNAREGTVRSMLRRLNEQEDRLDDLAENLQRAGFAWEKPAEDKP